MLTSEVNFNTFIKFRYMKISETDVNFGSLFAVTFIFTTLLFSLDFIVF